VGLQITTQLLPMLEKWTKIMVSNNSDLISVNSEKTEIAS
jgi:hypothetical protein